MKKVLILLFSILIAFSAVSCAPTYSHQINVGISSKPVTFDPQLAQSNDELMIARNIYEGLMRLNENGEVANGAAKSYKKNGTTYIFTLKDELTWSDNTIITAHDFVFAFRRAVDPKTNAPFSSLLSNIVGAEEAISGKKSPSSIAVQALDDNTLTIKLKTDDQNFLKVLTHAVTMPCNEKFFKDCAGKYGRDSENILSNGSYRILSWEPTTSVIKLARSRYYSGDFVAKTAYVVFRYKSNVEQIEALKESDLDIILTDFSYKEDLSEAGFNCIGFSNTIWMIVFSNDLPKELRLAFLQTLKKESNNSLVKPSGSIFPSITLSNNSPIGAGVINQNYNEAFKLFSNIVKKNYKGKVPVYKMIYPENQNINVIASSIASHWQSAIGACVNISSTSSASSLINSLALRQADIAIVPISVSTTNPVSVISKINDIADFAGISNSLLNSAAASARKQTKAGLIDAQKKLLEQLTLSPIFESNKYLVVSPFLSLPGVSFENGMCDFAFALKEFE